MKAIAVGLAVFVVLFLAVNITFNVVGPRPTPDQPPGWGQWLMLVAAWVLSGYAAARLNVNPIRTSAILGGVIAVLFIALSMAFFGASIGYPGFLGLALGSVAFCSLGESLHASRPNKQFQPTNSRCARICG